MTFALALGLTAVPANAQTSIAGTVTGQVTDASGAAVTGRRHKADRTWRRAACICHCQQRGGPLRFPRRCLPANTTITFTKDGFTTYDIKSQDVEVGIVLTLNAT